MNPIRIPKALLPHFLPPFRSAWLGGGHPSATPSARIRLPARCWAGLRGGPSVDPAPLCPDHFILVMVVSSSAGNSNRPALRRGRAGGAGRGCAHCALCMWVPGRPYSGARVWRTRGARTIVPSFVNSRKWSGARRGLALAGFLPQWGAL